MKRAWYAPLIVVERPWNLPPRRLGSGREVIDGMTKKSTHVPLGPGDTWKTGQRVPFAGDWADQYGDVTRFEDGHTFPPCIGRKGECAYRFLVQPAATAA